MLKKINYDIPGEISTNISGKTSGNIIVHAEITIPDNVIESSDLIQSLDRIIGDILAEVRSKTLHQEQKPKDQTCSYSPLQAVSDATKEIMNLCSENKPNF